MAKISLKSIQNNSINQVKPKPNQKPVKNVEINTPKQSDKVVIKQPVNKPSFNKILTNLQQNIVENNKNLINKQQSITEIQNSVQKQEIEEKEIK
jgi:hypothetical protein